MAEPMVAFAVGIAENNEESLALAREQLHDFLVASVRDRIGPVEWREMDLSDPANDLGQLLKDIGGAFADPANLRGYLRAASGMEHPIAVVTTVEHRVADA